MELGNAIRADPTGADLRLGHSVFAGRAETERAAMLSAKALHVTTGCRLGDAKVNPVTGKASVELLSSALGLCNGRSTCGVKDPPAAVTEQKFDALPDAILRDDQTRRPLDKAAI